MDKSEIRKILKNPSTELLSIALNYVNLTEREIAVLHLLAEGKSNKQISANLYISIHTTKAHLESIYYKY